ncbi:rod shape-determining protein MreD [Pseudomonas sp. F1_0610]|uniref:rod shape-determining protein MreD n=1 Tax=Pseudomonas sp. F1_0610 TaxID=3114284 RepID=UPI0039C0D89F
MSRMPLNNLWALIIVSLTIALVLSVAPIPVFLETARPLWVPLFLTYWVLIVPDRVGLTTAWVCGLLQDILSYTFLGQHALIYSVMIFFVVFVHRRFSMFPVWQQAAALFVFYVLGLLLQLWLMALGGQRIPALSFLLPALVSSLLWPWLFFLMRPLTKRLTVSSED